MPVNMIFFLENRSCQASMVSLKRSQEPGAVLNCLFQRTVGMAMKFPEN